MFRRRRPATERVSDFDDILLPYTAARARSEAARCLGCFDAPCTTGCDAAVDVKTFIRHLALADVQGAADTVRRANVLGWACARVCNADAACMRRCTRAQLDASVDIPGLEWYALETAYREGARRLPVGPDRGRSVAVVGAGPAGLAAVAELRRLGHRVALFDASASPGGLLVSGIPTYRLPRVLVHHEIDAILRTGVELHLEQAVDSLDELLRSYDAVIIATGLGRMSRLGVDGEDLEGVFPATWLLGGTVTDVGLRPMVVGGGNTAMDAATLAVRLAGPEGRVSLLYRRGEQQMPAYRHERRTASEESVIFRPLTVVERILGDRDGRVALVRCRAVDQGRPDASGRPAPVELSGGTFDLPATSVIVAAGEEPDPDLLARFGLTEAEPRGSEAGRTEREKVYVAGDIVGGPRTLAWAVRSGVRAARSVEIDLRSGSEPERAFPVLGPSADLSIDLLGRKLINPFLLAAAPCTDDLEMARAGLRAGWAGLVLKTIAGEETKVERKYPLAASSATGGRSMMALGSIDPISDSRLEDVIDRVASLKAELPDRMVVASITADSRTQWQKLARQLSTSGVDALECVFAGLHGSPGAHTTPGQDLALVRTATRWVKDAAGGVPVVVKLWSHDVGAVARAAAESGADALCATGSVQGLPGLDVESAVPLPSIGGKTSSSGMSGPAILPVALRAVAEASGAAAVPVIGNGGVASWRDAVAMMLLGASAVQVCTAVITHGFDLVETLRGGLARYMERHDVSSVSSIVGRALVSITTHDALVQPGAVRARVEESCIGCGGCYVGCRDGAFRAITWDPEARRPTVDLTRCTGCGLCACLCPTDSISLLLLK